MNFNWDLIELDEICELVTKGTTPTSIGYKYTTDGINFVKIESIDINGRFKPEKFAHINEATNEALKRSQLKNGDILFSIAGALGRVAIVPEDILPANTNQALAIIRIKEGVPLLREYLFSALSTGYSLEQIEKFRGGVAQQNLSLAQVKSFKIPIPPLPEQKRIVAILDEAFAAIDQAKAHIERNIQNAEELFQSKLNEIFSQRGEGWEESKLGEACEISMGQSPKGNTYNDKGIGTPLINGPVEFGPNPFSKTVMSKWTTAPTKMCKKGDLILCVRGSTTGRINIAGFEACIGRGVASIRYEKNQEWLNFFIRANQDQIYKLGSGSTFPNVSGKILKEIGFPEPPLELQNSLINRMNGLVEHTNQILKLYKEKLNRIEELKKSILQKAFSGELTADKVEMEVEKEVMARAAEPAEPYGIDRK